MTQKNTAPAWACTEGAAMYILVIWPYLWWRIVYG